MLRLCLLFLLAATVPAHADLSGAARIIDGDTLAIGTAGGEAIVRLHGIDAPERDQTCRVAGAPVACGAAATAALGDLIGGARVACTAIDMDRYDRIVGRCHVGGRDLGEILVRQGAAFAYARYSTDYLPAESRARADRLGVWAGRAVRPADHRADRRAAPRTDAAGGCAIKGNISSAGHVYHRPGDAHYDRTRIDQDRGERWFCSETDAAAAGWRAAVR